MQTTNKAQCDQCYKKIFLIKNKKIKNLSTKSFGNSERRAINSAWIGWILGRGHQPCKGMTMHKCSDAG